MCHVWVCFQLGFLKKKNTPPPKKGTSLMYGSIVDHVLRASAAGGASASLQLR
jgi:hypothetical protein